MSARGRRRGRRGRSRRPDVGQPAVARETRGGATRCAVQATVPSVRALDHYLESSPLGPTFQANKNIDSDGVFHY